MVLVATIFAPVRRTSLTTKSSMFTGACTLVRLNCFIMRGNSRLGTALSVRTGMTGHFEP